MLPSRRVVVTGVGLVTPLGVGVEQSWRRLLAGETAVRRLPSLDGLPAQIAAPVPREGEGGFSLAGCGLAAPGDETSLSTFVQFALAAADEALVQARWSPETRAEQERTGVAIGSGIGGLSDIVEASDALRERGARRVSPFFIPRMLVNMAAGQVSIRAGLRGPSAAPATACATGAHALADGLGMIRSGEADVVVAGGAEAAHPSRVAPRPSCLRSQRRSSVAHKACIEPLAVAGFARARALATSYNDAAAAPGASRPFDAERAGFVIGEGAAVMVLEEEGHARRRGATPLAELRAVGLSSDAHHITAPPDDGDGARRAMEAALRLGNVAPAELGYINAHATSTPTGDAAEAIAIAAIAAQRGGPGCGPLLVSSTKGATGHLLGAAGAAEAAFTVLALTAGRVPPTANLAAPEPASAAFEHVLPRETGPAGRAPLPELRAALCNSFGFGGMNASVLLTRPGLEWAMPKRGHLGG